MATLEERVRTLEDIQLITDLTMEVAHQFDNGYHPDGIIALFTDDAVFDGGPFGRHEGVEAIRQFFTDISAQITFSKHHLSTHSVTVNHDDDTATGQWYMWGTHTIGGEAMFLANTWNIRYRRQAGRWLVHEHALDWQFLTPLDTGWVKTPMAT
jgi:ketosteroid isomerase-like protein